MYYPSGGTWAKGRSLKNIRPALKKVVSGLAAGCVYIRAGWKLFFSNFGFFFQFLFFLLFFTIFLKKGKKKILRPPDWPQFWPPAGQETNFFKGGLTYNSTPTGPLVLVEKTGIKKKQCFLHHKLVR